MGRPMIRLFDEKNSQTSEHAARGGQTRQAGSVLPTVDLEHIEARYRRGDGLSHVQSNMYGMRCVPQPLAAVEWVLPHCPGSM